MKFFINVPASRIIAKALRNYGEMKRLNYRLLVKQYLKSKLANFITVKKRTSHPVCVRRWSDT